MSDVRLVVESLADQYLKWWKPTSDGRNLNGACPFHHEETEGAFYMSTETGLFICHGCQAKGSLNTFLKEIGASNRMRKSIMNQVGDVIHQRAARREVIGRKDPFAKHMPLNEGLLGILDYCPTALVEAGFDMTVLQKHDIGFDKEAMRITFPIRDHLGVLMGIAGRTVTGEYPRYKIYKEGDLLRFSEQYKGYHFEKKNFLWNMHNIYPEVFYEEGPGRPVYVVEGYKAALWMIQHGYLDTVAIMGTYLSFMQQRLLQRLSSAIYLFLDHTEAAEKGVYETGLRLRESNRVKVCCYPTRCEGGEQPDDLTSKELQTTMQTAVNFNQWRIDYERSRSEEHARSEFRA